MQILHTAYFLVKSAERSLNAECSAFTILSHFVTAPFKRSLIASLRREVALQSNDGGLLSHTLILQIQKRTVKTVLYLLFFNCFNQFIHCHFEKLKGNVEGRKQTHLCFCAQYENALFHRGGDNILCRLFAFDAEHKTSA